MDDTILTKPIQVGPSIVLGEAEGTAEPFEPADVDYAAEAQRSLASRLGRGVKIVTGRKKGRIELEYYGLDDLNDLLEALALLKTSRKGPEA